MFAKGWHPQSPHGHFIDSGCNWQVQAAIKAIHADLQLMQMRTTQGSARDAPNPASMSAALTVKRAHRTGLPAAEAQPGVQHEAALLLRAAAPATPPGMPCWRSCTTWLYALCSERARLLDAPGPCSEALLLGPPLVAELGWMWPTGLMLLHVLQSKVMASRSQGAFLEDGVAYISSCTDAMGLQAGSWQEGSSQSRSGGVIPASAVLQAAR